MTDNSPQSEAIEAQETDDATVDADVAREALEAAVAENPEAVVAFVERLGLVNELLDTTALATGAFDDDMVERLAGTSSLLLESADGLATRETAALAGTVGESADDLEQALETLVRLQRSGTLDELAELADAATLLTSAVDDEMVEELARTGSSLGEVADVANDPDTVAGLQMMLRSVGRANRESAEPLGLRGIVRTLRDPALGRGIRFLVAVARGIGRDLWHPGQRR